MAIRLNNAGIVEAIKSKSGSAKFYRPSFEGIIQAIQDWGGGGGGTSVLPGGGNLPNTGQDEGNLVVIPDGEGNYFMYVYAGGSWEKLHITTTEVMEAGSAPFSLTTHDGKVLTNQQDVNLYLADAIQNISEKGYDDGPITEALEQEIKAREDGDEALANSLEQEIKAREDEDEALKNEFDQDQKRQDDQIKDIIDDINKSTDPDDNSTSYRFVTHSEFQSGQKEQDEEWEGDQERQDKATADAIEAEQKVRELADKGLQSSIDGIDESLVLLQGEIDALPVTVKDTQPEGENGDLWFDSDETLQLFVRYDNEWVVASPPVSTDEIDSIASNAEATAQEAAMKVQNVQFQLDQASEFVKWEQQRQDEKLAELAGEIDDLKPTEADLADYVKKSGDQIAGQLKIRPAKADTTSLLIYSGNGTARDSKEAVLAIVNSHGESLLEVHNNGRIKAGGRAVEYVPTDSRDVITKEYCDSKKIPGSPYVLTEKSKKELNPGEFMKESSGVYHCHPTDMHGVTHYPSTNNTNWVGPWIVFKIYDGTGQKVAAHTCTTVWGQGKDNYIAWKNDTNIINTTLTIGDTYYLADGLFLSY